MNVKALKRFSFLFVPLLFILLGFLLYSQSFSGSYYFDDYYRIVFNPVIQNTTMFTHSLLSFSWLLDSRIIPDITFYLNYSLFGLETWSFRLVNLVIHIINACLVFQITRKLLNQMPSTSSSFTVAFLVALFFLMHPIQTSAVTYIVQRMEILATTFYLIGFFCFMHFMDIIQLNKIFITH